jgi:hypothetical protein
MRVRLSPAALAAASVAAILLCAPSAAANTVVGSSCSATIGISESTVAPIQNSSSNPLPITVPFTGIATEWRFNSSIPFSEPHLLLTLRPTGGESEFEATAEGPLVLVREGANTFNLRMPVRGGERFGIWGPTNTFVCTGEGARIAYLTGQLPVFAKGAFTVDPNPIEAAGTVAIELDADGDGYGDETQDGCPQSGRYQSPCPVLSLDSHAVVSRRSVLVLVSASDPAPLTVSASATIPRKPGKATASARVRLTPETTMTAEGTITRVRLPFKPRLISALRSLPRKRSVKLSVRSTATDLAGRVSTDAATVRLRGRG